VSARKRRPELKASLTKSMLQRTFAASGITRASRGTTERFFRCRRPH
jgi:hypothetical protein